MKNIFLFLTFSFLLYGYDEIKIKSSTSCEATLVAHDTGKDKAILFIHGYNDYFFHEHLAKRFIDEGFDFYALDLHGYGRSIECEQNYNIYDISDYFTELENSINTIRSRGVKDLTIVAHSQGGLMATMYAKEHNNFERLVLNAPFYEVYSNGFVVNVLKPFVGWIGGAFKDGRLPDIRGESPYNKDLYKRWHFDKKLKKLKTDGLYLGYLNAINRAQRELKEGAKFAMPLLLLSSDKNGDVTNPEELVCSDTVISVQRVKELSQEFEGDITYIPIKDAQHDIYLSYNKPRNKAIDTTIEWIKSKLPQ